MASYVAPPKAGKKKGGLRGQPVIPMGRLRVTKKGQTMASTAGKGAY